MAEGEGLPGRRQRLCNLCGTELVSRRLQSGHVIVCDARPSTVVNRAGLLVVGCRPHAETCAGRAGPDQDAGAGQGALRRGRLRPREGPKP